jgi:hypothetical protein
LPFEHLTSGKATTDGFNDLRHLGHVNPMTCDLGTINVDLQIIEAPYLLDPKI